MTFSEFEQLVSAHRIAKYLRACNGNSKKTMVLYRANLRLANELFSVIGMFEVILRNKIDEHYKVYFRTSVGNHQWLHKQTESGGCFYNNLQVDKTYKKIVEAKRKLFKRRIYTHDKLVAELDFGFWRYMFGSKEFMAAGSTLHQIFKNRPHNTNHTDIFNKLGEINGIRNRLAHHEPICFNSSGQICTAYATHHHNIVYELLSWLDIRPRELLYGIDKVNREIHFINNL